MLLLLGSRPAARGPSRSIVLAVAQGKLFLPCPQELTRAISPGLGVI